MKFGSREIANVVFRAKQDTKIGNMTFANRQPVLYIDTAKTSTTEGAADAVYANGGRGNPRLITWEGNKTVTFTVEDALLSPVGFAILSGAGLIHGAKDTSGNISAQSTENANSLLNAVSAVKGSSGININSMTGASDITYEDFVLDAVGDSATITRSVTDTTPDPDVTYLVTITIVYEAENAYSWTASRVAADSTDQIVHIHKTIAQQIDENGYIDLTGGLTSDDEICSTTGLIFIMETEADGSLTGATVEGTYTVINDTTSTPVRQGIQFDAAYVETVKGKKVLVDFYSKRSSAQIYELQINAEDFAGSYYVEAETLFRRQDTGADLPAIFTLPNVKIQSNWTFSMSADGDPSTFTFTMDAMPDYTYFDNTKKMLCVIQIVDDNSQTTRDYYTVMGHKSGEQFN